MPTARETLKRRLVHSPAARITFMNSLLSAVREQGIDVDNEAEMKDLGLNFDLSDGEKFFRESLASTIVITITK